MTKTRKQILLLIMVVAVWVGVIYRLFNLSTVEDLPFQALNFKAPEVNQAKKKPYIFKLNFRDPFLNNMDIVRGIEVVNTERIVKEDQSKKIQQKETIKLSYLGCINSQFKKAALVSINNEILMVDEGDSIADFILKSYTQQSMVLMSIDTALTYHLTDKR